MILPFFRGERPHALALVIRSALAIGAVVLFVLVILSRGDTGDARRAAKADRVALLKVTAALRTQCAQQLAEQTRLRDLERTDADLQRGLIAADAKNSVIDDDIRATRRHVYALKLAKDLEFLSLPPQSPAVCGAFNDILPIAFRQP